MREERAMSAIMLDEEKPQEKPCGWDGQEQSERIVNVEREPHQAPKERQWWSTHRQLQ